MDISKFLDLALELETEISKLYEFAAELSGDQPVAAQLRMLASAELNHANIIRTGISFHDTDPDLLKGIRMDSVEAAAGLDEARSLHVSLEQGSIRFLDGLRRLLDLEERFERIHVTASVVFADLSMKTLFESLAKGDKSHIMTHRALIESFGGIV